MGLRALARAVGGLWTRAIEAGGGGRRFKGLAGIGNLNAVILASATTAAHRAGALARNNPWVGSGVESIVADTIGTGIVPLSRHPDKAVRDRLHALWDRFVEQSDPTGVSDFYGQQGTMVQAMVEGGESFARLLFAPGPGLVVPLQVQLVNREQVPLDQFGVGFVRATENRVRAGIEFDAAGRRRAYWVLPQRLDDPFGPLGEASLTPVRIPAGDMIHLFKPLTEGQLRGLSWLAPIVLRAAELDKFEDAALTRAQMANMLAGFIKDPNNRVRWEETGDDPAAAADSGILDITLEPGMMAKLPQGAEIAFSDPPEFPDYPAFVKAHLRAIASGLQYASYEDVSGDYEGVTFSSIRARLNALRRRLERLQHTVVGHQLCRPVWQRFVDATVLAGLLRARDFLANRHQYYAVDFLPPRWAYVNPVDDVEAEVLQINNFLKPLQQAIAERGFDPEQVFAQMEQDLQRIAGLAALRADAAALPGNERRVARLVAAQSHANRAAQIRLAHLIADQGHADG